MWRCDGVGTLVTLISLLRYHIKDIYYPILQRQYCINTNVRGLVQPGDVTTRCVTMDTYLVAQCAQHLSRYAKPAECRSYYLLSSLAQVSRDKTSLNCQRRITYMAKSAATIQNVNVHSVIGVLTFFMCFHSKASSRMLIHPECFPIDRIRLSDSMKV